MNYWLMKSEPNEYSITNLKLDKTTFWYGIRNYQVRNLLRDEIKVGDLALFYHSNAGKETGVVGVMKVVSGAYADKTQFDKNSHYYDAKSDPATPRWLGVEVRYKSTLKRTVTLTEIKQNKIFIDLPLIKKGNRLSIQHLSAKQFNDIVNLANK